MIKRIIYFVESPFRHFDYERYKIELLILNGFEVEIWDFTAFLYPHVIEHSQIDLMKGNNIHVFKNLQAALHSIDRLTETDLVFIHIGYNYKHYKIYKHLSSVKVSYLVTQLANFPFVSTAESKDSAVRYLKALFNPIRVFNYIFTRLPYKVLGFRGAHIVLSAGTRSKSNRYPISKNAKIIWAHTYEYDRILSNMSVQSPHESKKYCLFIDQNIPFHVDYMYDGNGIRCDPDNYYTALDVLFNYLEAVFNIEIRIAAHPRTDITMLKKYFKEKTITTDNIIHEIKQSYLVISHDSTAILYAVLFQKPIIFITNDYFVKTNENALILRLADELGKIPINIDHKYRIDAEEELSVSDEKYSSYIEHYVKKKDSPQKYSTQILADYLKTIG
jgi:hypothetical protein